MVSDSEFGEGTPTVRAVGLIRQPPSLVRAGTVVMLGVVVVTGAAMECVHAGPAAWALATNKTGLRSLNRVEIVPYTHISVHGTGSYSLGGPPSEAVSGHPSGSTTPTSTRPH